MLWLRFLLAMHSLVLFRLICLLSSLRVLLFWLLMHCCIYWPMLVILFLLY